MTVVDYFSIFLGEVLLVLMIFIASSLFFEKDKRLALKTLVAVAVTWGIVRVIKSLFPETRPFGVLDIKPLVNLVRVNDSFPSAHAAVSFAIATSVWLAKHKLGLLLLVMAFGVSIGRVLLWVHFPIDVIVGAIIGVTVVLVINRLNLFGWGND